MELNALRICVSCHQEKPIGDFGARKRSRDGTSTVCQPRVSADSRKQFEKHRERKLESGRKWYREHAVQRIAQTGVYQKVHPEASRKSALRWWRAHKAQAAENFRRWRLANRGRWLEWKRDYRRRHREYYRALYHRWRAEVSGSDAFFTEQEWLSLLKACGNRCLSCGKHESELVSIYPGHEIALEVDHIVPLSKGGSGGIENIQPLCSGCNNGKRAKAIDYRPPEIRLAFCA
jgi:5-methylcytosine-specific restriction endonuclease McrA